MPKLTVQMTEAELFALDMIAYDKQEWADNVLTERARVAKDALKTMPEWAQAIGALAQAGGDVTDDWAVLLKGRELGMFVTAKDRHDAILAQQTSVQPVATETI